MNSEIRRILEQLKEGTMDVDEALLQIKEEPFKDIGYAKVDLHRKVRQGAAEVIYGAGKTPEQIRGILQVPKEGLPVRQEFKKRSRQHIPGSAHSTVKISGLHYFASFAVIWLIMLARYPAPKPLSILTTETPLAQELSMERRAVRPPKAAP